MTFWERHKYKLILTAVTLLLVAVMAFSTLSGGRANPISNALGVIASPVQKAVSWVVNGTQGFFDYLVHMKRFESDNRDLKEKVTELENEVRETEQLEKENAQLRALLDLREREAQYDTCAAEIIARDSGNFFNTFVIDKGSRAGIQAGNAVITDAGLVGHVYETGATWARVRTIIDPSSAAGAQVKRTGDACIAAGDFTLAQQGRCVLSYLQKDVNIMAGDAIETAGTGGIYPAGLYIGRVEEVIEDSDGIGRRAIIVPGADFSSLRQVLVIRQVMNMPEVSE